MNKNRIYWLIFPVLFLWAIPALAQNAFYDALTLARADKTKLSSELDNSSLRQGLIDKLKAYFTKNEGSLIEIFENSEMTYNNINSILRNLRPSEFRLMFGASEEGNILQKFSNAEFQSNLINAVGSIITERFKEDLTTIYVEKVKAKLKEESIGDKLKVLCPHTYGLVRDNNPFRYPSLGKEWKAAFKADLEDLILNVFLFIKNDEGPLRTKEWFPYLELGVSIANPLIHGNHPVEILNAVDLSFRQTRANAGDEARKSYERIHKIIHMLNLVQANLRKIEKSDFSPAQAEEWVSYSWIDFQELKELVEKGGIPYFLGLLYLADKEFFDKHNDLVQLMGDSETFFYQKLQPIFQLLTNIGKLDQKKNATPEDYAVYMQLVLDMMKTACDLFKAKVDNWDPVLFEYVQKCIDVYKGIYRKDYSGVIRLVASMILPSAESKELKGFFARLVFYADFVEGVANAKDAAELKAVIKSVILPSGSFLVKRTSPFSITVTAHPGVFYGGETLNATGMQKGVTGFTAPVGLDFSLGSVEGWSISPFVSLFDLGAVVSYRLTSDAADYPGFPETITLKQVFSPGAALNIGIAKSPLTFGVGVQSTPELRRITKEEVVFQETKSWRWFVRLTWDIPLIHICSIHK